MDVSESAWMERSLRLASLSLGMTWPNPGVAAVVVRDGRLLGQGRHQVCGREHAEVLALADARARGHDPAGATVYVTLAPCTRHGRQPPCVEALAAARVATVIAAVADGMQDDPAPLLERHGISYRVGLLAEPARRIHGGFLCRITKGRPRITGKWAMTLDGCLATTGGDSGWISTPGALARARRRRRAFDAILIGGGTARRDDPALLSTRPRFHATPGAEPTASPLRIVVSADADLPVSLRLLQTLSQAPLLIVHDHHAARKRLARLAALGTRLLAVTDAHDPVTVAQALGAYGLNDVLVEGGSSLHAAWMRAGLYDRLEIYVGPLTTIGGRSVAAGPGVAHMTDAAHWLAEGPARVIDGTVVSAWVRG